MQKNYFVFIRVANVTIYSRKLTFVPAESDWLSANQSKESGLPIGRICDVGGSHSQDPSQDEFDLNVG